MEMNGKDESLWVELIGIFGEFVKITLIIFKRRTRFGFAFYQKRYVEDAEMGDAA